MSLRSTGTGFCLLLLVLCLLAGCKEDNPLPTDPVGLSNSVLILNEGTFNFGNASLSIYDPVSGDLENNAYSNRTGRVIGDVGQSMSRVGDELYIVVNHSARIEVVDLVDFSHLGSINLPGSPRRLFALGEERAVVSHLFNNKLDLLDLDTKQRISTVPRECQIDTLYCGNEHILSWDDQLLILNYDEKAIFFHDSESLQVIEFLHLNAVPNSMVIVEDQLYVLCGGNFGQELCRLFQIDLNAKTIVDSRVLGTLGQRAGSLFDSGAELWYIQQHVYKQDYDLATEPVQAVAAVEGQTLYGLAVDPERQRLYVADAIDYVQSGVVQTYDYQSMAPIDTLRVGVIPSRFLFLD